MSPEPPPSTGTIFRFYFPLALSWLFMSIESPVSIGLISRLPDPKIQTATFLVLMGLALWIESPIIDLLATSTTLCRDRRSLAVISRFVWWLMGWCTVVHALIVLTPLYGFVTARVLSLPEEVSSALHLPLTIMIPWSACIGWRRFRQGILIRSGLTRSVGIGTLVRLTTMTGVGVTLMLSGRLTGTAVAAVALIASVLAEALFAQWASQGAAAKLPALDETQQSWGASGELTMGRLARFHLPLTATTVLTLSTGPIVVAALAKSSDAVLAMASWQVSSTLVWMHRTVVFALPEMVIALYRGPETVAKLRSFCVAVGGASSGLLALLWFTRADVAFFRSALGAPPDTAALAHTAAGLCLLFPFLGALQSYARGMLTVHHRTMPRLFAVCAGMAFLLGGLGIGLSARWQGVAIAAFAMTVGLLAEWAVLAWANVRSLRGTAA